MSDDEKLDKFCAGLKPEVRLEVLNSGPENVYNAAANALKVDSAFIGSGLFSSSIFPQVTPMPMEIGNTEGRTRYRGKSFKGRNDGSGFSNQKQKDIANDACFLCHKKGCRARNHRDDKVGAANAAMMMNQNSHSDSEN